MRFLILLLTTIIIFNTNCHKNPDDPGEDSFVYPVATGNYWKYSREFIQFNIHPDSLKALPSDTLRGTSEVKVISKVSLSNSTEAYMFLERLFENGKYIESNSYFNNHKNGFYLYAYSGNSSASPFKIAAGKRIYFNGYEFYNVRDIFSLITEKSNYFLNSSDSIHYENPPLICLHYPIKVGVRWVYRVRGNPWLCEKKVIGEEVVKTPAGEFNCFIIKWLIDMDDNGEFDSNIEFFDYISEKGLIIRSIIIRGMILKDEKRKKLGSFDSKDEYVLTEYHLK
ncbi:hypothetical protein DRQ09_08785 [candidate division KSB1 bacterium]|nr:MAG: hypothetical protein DRQ09_08785 [candidate division KSB1 bacterium]